MLAMMEAGTMPMALPFVVTSVDVRDVARAHILAYENNSAQGRYIVDGIFPDIRKPKLTLPKFLVPTIPAMDQLMHLMLRQLRTIIKEFVAEVKDKEFKVSTGKIEREFGWCPQVSLADCVRGHHQLDARQGDH